MEELNAANLTKDQPPETEEQWNTVFNLIRSALPSEKQTAISSLTSQHNDPFRVLISTIISLRTKDDVTEKSSKRLFSKADTPEKMAGLSEGEIARLIYPAGFYNVKASQIAEVSSLLRERYNSKVPADREELLKLPGVGRKTANLTLGIGYNVPAICVDIHVHRIPNRIGWINTSTPEATEKALEEILPQQFWIAINHLLVTFGQEICTPRSPRCSQCPLKDICCRTGVTHSR